MKGNLCKNNKRTPLPNETKRSFEFQLKFQLHLRNNWLGKRAANIKEAKKWKKHPRRKCGPEQSRTMENELKKAVTHRSVSECANFFCFIFIAVGSQCDDDSCFFSWKICDFWCEYVCGDDAFLRIFFGVIGKLRQQIFTEILFGVCSHKWMNEWINEWLNERTNAQNFRCWLWVLGKNILKKVGKNRLNTDTS